MNKDIETPSPGVLPAVVFYFVFMFSLCFLKPAHHQLSCFFTGLFIYPVFLLFPVAVIALTTAVLALMKKKLQPWFMAASIAAFPVLSFIAMKLFRHVGDDLMDAVILTVISCGIGWGISILRPSYWI